jgi:hypothetical protein
MKQRRAIKTPTVGVTWSFTQNRFSFEAANKRMLYERDTLQLHIIEIRGAPRGFLDLCMNIQLEHQSAEGLWMQPTVVKGENHNRAPPSLLSLCKN